MNSKVNFSSHFSYVVFYGAFVLCGFYVALLILGWIKAEDTPSLIDYFFPSLIVLLIAYRYLRVALVGYNNTSIFYKSFFSNREKECSFFEIVKISEFSFFGILRVTIHLRGGKDVLCYPEGCLFKKRGQILSLKENIMKYNEDKISEQ